MRSQIMFGAPQYPGDRMNKIIFVLLAAALTLGCMGVMEEEHMAGEQARDMGVSTSALAPAEAYAGSGNAYGEYVAKEGSMTIRVQEGTLDEKYESMKSMLQGEGAQMSDVRYNEYGDRKQYTMTVKVSPSRFESISDSLREVGEVKSISVSLEDVTQQYVDTETRIKNKEIELARLYELYNKSAKVDDLLSVEREVSRVETELELLKGQKQYLDSRVQRSTIAITLYEDKPAATQLTNPLENLGALFFGALAAAITLMVLAAGFLLPLVLVLAVLWFIVKRVLSGRKAKKG